MAGYFAKQQVCHLCRAIQWVAADEAPAGANSPELLYSRFGSDAAHRQTNLVSAVSFRISYPKLLP